MHRVLLTAYGPYDEWQQNASWLVLQELLHDMPPHVELVTRLYPVDFTEVRARLEEDLKLRPDTVVSLGQAPGNARVAIEGVGLNVARDRGVRPEDAVPLDPAGPPAYFSALPLKNWAQRLRTEGVPAEVSYHAGTFLCNAALYWSHHLSHLAGYPTQATFLHLPLASEQAIDLPRDYPSLPVSLMAHGLRRLLDDLASGPVA